MLHKYIYQFSTILKQLSMKHYVVRNGYKPGIYTTRDEAKSQIEWYPWAKYKSFPNLETAQQAYEHNFVGEKGKYTQDHLRILMKEDYDKAIATDAACPSNPWPIEYRGVSIKDNKEIFTIWPLSSGSTNIAEYLGIIHGLAWMMEHPEYSILYSDSKIAINRVESNTFRTQIQEDDSNQELRNIIRRAQDRLQNNHHRKQSISIKKRPTKLRGQIPADFGRK